MQKKEKGPACAGVKVCDVVHGPGQVGWPNPGSEKVRLWSTPTSLLIKVAVTAAPTFTRITARSKTRFSAVTVTEAGDGEGGAVAVGGGALAAGGEVGAAELVAVETAAVGLAGAAVEVAVRTGFAGVAVGAEVVVKVAAGNPEGLGFALSPPPPQAAEASVAANASPTNRFVRRMFHPFQPLIRIGLRPGAVRRIEMRPPPAVVNQPRG